MILYLIFIFVSCLYHIFLLMLIDHLCIRKIIPLQILSVPIIHFLKFRFFVTNKSFSSPHKTFAFSILVSTGSDRTHARTQPRNASNSDLRPQRTQGSGHFREASRRFRQERIRKPIHYGSTNVETRCYNSE